MVFEVTGTVVINAPGSAIVQQGSASPIGLSIDDTNDGAIVTVTLSDSAGLLSANTGAGGGGTISDTGTTSLTIVGTLDQVNADLTTLTDQENSATADTITIDATDNAGGSAAPASIAVAVPTLTTLVSFSSDTGAYPAGSLIADSSGDLFGTTTYGGGAPDYSGNVFELINDGGGSYTSETLASFDGPNGFYPYGSLFADSSGDLFGTTSAGGATDNNDGTVFELVNTGTAANPIYASTATPVVSFDGTDGDYPVGSLIADSNGNLFGTTAYGGNGYQGITTGDGTVFELVHNSDGSYTFTPLVNFNITDGANPQSSLIVDASGNLFGTTEYGGTSGDGTVFELANTGTVANPTYTSPPTTLASFDGTYGSFLYGSLIADTSGDLFGTANEGGANGDGTVFELVSNGGGSYTPITLLNFDGTDGANPTGSLIADANGNLFGTTEYGGANDKGTVFELSKTATGYAASVLSFNGTDGAGPEGSMIADSSGDLFGATNTGGTDGFGTVFEITDSGYQAPCYCRGTLILAEHGERPVEDLKIGDLVATRTGQRPIKWIGTRAYDPRFIRGQKSVLPIVISAGALARGVPARDLWVSPEHALYIDSALVPARLLVNGMTISQVEVVDRAEYFHLEFENHEIIFAEGAAAESYVESDNRRGFHNFEEFAALYPDDVRPSFRECATRVTPETPALAAIRRKLFDRAEVLGHPTTDDPDLHLIADGEIIRPCSVENDLYTFMLDRKPREIRLASSSAVPAELELSSTDTRRLGACIERIVLRDDYVRLDISHAHPSLCEGFHEDEGSRRWTDGMALLPDALLPPFADSLTIEVKRVAARLRYPLRAAAAPGGNCQTDEPAVGEIAKAN